MKATETPFITFMQKTTQFIIPIYQRKYSWEYKQCKQLWDDVLRASVDDTVVGHFIGSIVYISEGLYEVSSVPQVLLIDGQQRLTTLSLFLFALGKMMKEQGIEGEISQKKINNYYLFNREEEGEKHYKLILTQTDKDTFINIIEDRDLPAETSEQIIENYNFFLERIRKSNVDLEKLYKGIRKLMIVSISLDRTSDDPQLIFESLNSTGLRLSQADLVRNYVLMGLQPNEQEEIYKTYWSPMEQRFVKLDESKYFDRFMRDYLTVMTGQLPNIGQVYESFKDYWETIKDIPIKETMENISRYSKYYENFVSGNFDDEEISGVMRDINTLKVDVVYPFLLEVLEDYSNKLISKNELYEILRLAESYVFRRAICEVPPNSLNKTFAFLSKEIDKENYLESLKAAFIHKASYRRFPNDDEFRREFQVKNVYHFRSRPYMFNKLENHDRKEKISFTEYTVEHIMPQNPILLPEWRAELGKNWHQIHNDYLHTVGNLTLTGYNPELADRPFLEKRDMKGGFADSPIHLNRDLAKLEHWDEAEIKKRAQSLAELAIKIWSAPHLPQDVLDKYQVLEEPEEDEVDEEESEKITWEDQLARANPENKENVIQLMALIKQRFDCVGEEFARWYGFYIEKPTVRRNRFAILKCGTGTANICIRVDPKTFNFNDSQIRIVKGWFFPPNTERRISINKYNFDEILKYLEHSYMVTKDFSEIEFQRWSKVAQRAVQTRKANEGTKNLDSFTSTS